MTDLTLLYGHPVPYSVTVQRAGRSITRLSARHLAEVERRLSSEAGAYIERVDGAYVWYATHADGQPIEPHHTSLRSMDVGFDLRRHPEMTTALPPAPAYRIETDAGDVYGCADYAIRRLRRLGYRARVGA